MGTEAESGVEKTRVMRPQFTAGWVVRNHLRGVLRRDRNTLTRQQQVEGLRLEDDALAALGADGLPEVGRVARRAGHVEQPRVRARLVADHALVVAAQIDTQE